MNIDESKCDSSRRTDRISTTSKRTAIVLNDATDQISKILGASADVVGNRFLCFPVMSPHESTFIAESEFHKTCIAYDDALKSFQFVNRDRANTCLPDFASPPLRAGARRPFALDRHRGVPVTEEKKGARLGGTVLSGLTGV